MSFSEIETEIMVEALAGSNHAYVALHGPYRAAATALHSRGVVNIQGHSLSISTEGARAMIAAKVCSLADFTGGMNAMLSGLQHYRSVVESGLCDTSVCDGWEIVPDCPFRRIPLAVLVKAGKVERREDGQTVYARAL